MTNDEIRDLALSHGFTLRSQPDGAMDLNPYVYAFARALIEREREECARIARKASDDIEGAEIARAIRARGES